MRAGLTSTAAVTLQGLSILLSLQQNLPSKEEAMKTLKANSVAPLGEPTGCRFKVLVLKVLEHSHNLSINLSVQHNRRILCAKYLGTVTNTFSNFSAAICRKTVVAVKIKLFFLLSKQQLTSQHWILKGRETFHYQ